MARLRPRWHLLASERTWILISFEAKSRADIARGRKKARQRDDELSKARFDFDWNRQFELEQLVSDGFHVLVYTSDDPIIARYLKDAGATSVMPAGSPIGSGQGILNPNNMRIVLEYLKDGAPDYPVIVDAGVGTASDVSAAMELGCDGVLLNTSIASAVNPLTMAAAMRHACEAGRLAYLGGRIPKKLYATASSPVEDRISASKVTT